MVGLPLSRPSRSALWPPSRTSAMSLRCTTEPSLRGADDDVLELVGRREPALRRHRQRELGARRRRLAADATGRRRGVLLAHRGGDVVDGQAELRHPLGIELQQHRELAAAEHRRVADARAAA